MICEMCKKEVDGYRGLSSHIVKTHKITCKEYYDTYYKKKNENICPTCKKYTSFISIAQGYKKHCNQKCANNDINIIQQKKNTTKQKFGVDCYLAHPDSRKLCKAKLQTDEVKEKRKQTCKEKYGGNAPSCSKEVRNKMIKTNQDKYGVDNAFKLRTIQEKQKNTLLHKYGVNNSYQIQKVRNKAHSKEALQKHYNTMKENKTFKTSKMEDDCYNMLIKYFSDIKRNYKSDLYPYRCDFYIPKLNLYIECNFHWTHGGHFFDENNPEDIKIAMEWKQKSQYFKNAYNTWTKRDVKKRKCANKNKLNYIVFWTYDEFLEWINNDFIID